MVDEVRVYLLLVWPRVQLNWPDFAQESSCTKTPQERRRTTAGKILLNSTIS